MLAVFPEPYQGRCFLSVWEACQQVSDLCLEPPGMASVEYIPLNHVHGAQPASFVSLNEFQACLFAKRTCQLRTQKLSHKSVHFFQERTMTLQLSGDDEVQSVRCTSNKFDPTEISYSFVRSNVVSDDRHDIFERLLGYVQDVRQMLIMVLRSEALFINHWQNWQKDRRVPLFVTFGLCSKHSKCVEPFDQPSMAKDNWLGRFFEIVFSTSFVSRSMYFSKVGLVMLPTFVYFWVNGSWTKENVLVLDKPIRSIHGHPWPTFQFCDQDWWQGKMPLMFVVGRLLLRILDAAT